MRFAILKMFLICLMVIASASLRGAVPVVCGYVFPNSSKIAPGQVDPHAMNRINYAFAGIADGRLVLANPSDAENLKRLTALRRGNPSLKVLISVGGWLGSGGFSEMALTRASRTRFVASAMEFVKVHELDGIDLDWEYPGLTGAGNHFRSEDKKNFTLLLQELRGHLTEMQKRVHRRLLLTIAAGATDEYLAHTEMAKVQRLVDEVNLMTYDAYEADADETTGNHAPLFVDPADPKKESADRYVKAFVAAGVPAAKIVLGVPFYGHMWAQVADVDHGLFQRGQLIPHSYAPYGRIKSTMLGHGYERFWDAQAQVPWLYSPETRVFVSYEDPESLRAKCNYVLARKLGGVMFWNLDDDSSDELLGTIDQALLHSATGGVARK